MNLNEIQRLIVANAERYSNKHNIETDLEWLLLKLTEECGEFANALLVYKQKCRQDKIVDETKAKENLDKELMDVFTTLLLLADNLDINLLKTLDADVLRKGKKYLESSNSL